MKVYILTAVSFPYGMAPTNRIICYAKALMSQNMDCQVVCFRRTELVDNDKRSGLFEGVPFKYVGRKSTRPRNSLLAKILDVWDHLILLLRLILVLKPSDVVLSYGSTLHYGNLLVWVTHLKKSSFVRDLVEIPNVTLNDTKKQRKKRQRELERQFPRYEGVIAISTALVDLARKYARKNCSVIKVPILVDYEKYCIADTSREQPVPFIFHSGTLTEQKDGFVGMVRAFGEASKKLSIPIRFISTGDVEKSPHKNEILSLVEEYNLQDRLIFTGYLTNEELKHYLMGASLVIINKYHTEQNVYCFSTKLGEYMAAGKPIIITRIGEAMNWLNNGLDSIIIEPEKQCELSNSIVRVFESQDLRTKLSDNARITCKKYFDFHNYGKTLTDFFIQIVNERS